MKISKAVRKRTVEKVMVYLTAIIEYVFPKSEVLEIGIMFFEKSDFKVINGFRLTPNLFFPY